MEKQNSSSEERIKKFKEKVDKVVFMRDLGMLSEEDLEKLKIQLLKDIDEDK